MNTSPHNRLDLSIMFGKITTFFQDLFKPSEEKISITNSSKSYGTTITFSTELYNSELFMKVKNVDQLKKDGFNIKRVLLVEDNLTTLYATPVIKITKLELSKNTNIIWFEVVTETLVRTL